ncbi:MAG TPA: DUF4159 domain-containing protein, partial [Phycisphaerae bacterium]|nr:DUF4159 domain-containing protein [Phycisphaerae bacterium]
GVGGEGPGGRGPGGAGGNAATEKAVPGAGWVIAALPPGAGGQGPGGGQGGLVGAGTGAGVGVGEGVGPGAGPVGPLAPGSGTAGPYVPAMLAAAVRDWALPGLGGLLGAGSGPGTGLGGPGEGAGKLEPLLAPGGGPLVAPAGAGTGLAVALGPGGGGGGAPGGRPVGFGLPAVGGTGRLGLLPLPDAGGGLMVAGLPTGGPGVGGGATGAAGEGDKSAPGGLYTGVSGSFDMPMGVTMADYQADAEGMTNLLEEVRGRTNVHVTIQERYVPLTLENIRQTPILHLRGHRPFSFTDQERDVLRQYVAQGGTIFGEDSHGPFGECFRREMKKIFGEAPGDLPMDHDLYRAHYVLDRVPAGDMGERYPLQGVEVGGRLGVIFSRNDYGDCWEGTGGWVRPEAREPAFKMGVNVFTYVVAHWNQNRQ